MMTTGKDGKQTLIEEGTAFQGSFASDCPIIVKGRLEGDISGPSLTVSSTGGVKGKVKVEVLKSEGELAGEYDADTVVLSGSVKDNTIIRARSLEVSLAPEKGRMQVVFGECELEVGDIPTKAEAIAKNAEPSETPDEPAAEVEATDTGSDATVEAKAEEAAPADEKTSESGEAKAGAEDSSDEAQAKSDGGDEAKADDGSAVEAKNEGADEPKKSRRSKKRRMDSAVG